MVEVVEFELLVWSVGVLVEEADAPSRRMGALSNRSRVATTGIDFQRASPSFSAYAH